MSTVRALGEILSELYSQLPPDLMKIGMDLDRAIMDRVGKLERENIQLRQNVRQLADMVESTVTRVDAAIANRG